MATVKQLTKTRSASDPVYAAIDKHVATYLRMDRAVGARNRLEGNGGHPNSPNKPGFAAAERAQDMAMDDEKEDFEAICATRATTAEGVAAAAAFVRARHIDARGPGWCQEEAPILTGLERMIARFAPRPRSAEFQRVRAIIAHIEAGTRKRAVVSRKYQKTAKAKAIKKGVCETEKGPDLWRSEGDKQDDRCDSQSS